MNDGSASLESLGFTDGCELRVFSSAESAARGVHQKSDVIPLDVPTTGDAAILYEHVAERLGIPDASRIALFNGTAPIPQDGDLSSAPLVDGAVLSTYVTSSLRLPFSVLSQSFATGDTTSGAASASSSGSSSSSSAPASQIALPASVACFSTDTIEEVRDRIVRAIASKSAEHAARIRGSKVFIVDSAEWASHGSECKTMAALARILGNFQLVPCSESVRLSRLGINDESSAHVMLVPEQNFLVEIQVHLASALVATPRLRIPGIFRLAEVGKMLERELQRGEHPHLSCTCIEWALNISTEQSPTQRADLTDTTPTVRAQSPRLVSRVA